MLSPYRRPQNRVHSTAELFFENRQRLAEHGWVYPEVSLRGFGHHDLAFLISGGYPEWAIPQERSLDELTDDLIRLAAENPKLVISSENFYLFPNPEKVADILCRAGFPLNTIKVVVYIRRQDEVHISWYNQVVKAQGYSESIQHCIKDNAHLWNYQLQLEKWAEVFGRENLIVRPYQQNRTIEGDIRKDFLNLLGLSHERFSLPHKKINTKINRDILEVQRIINILPLSTKEKRSFHKELMELTSLSQNLDVFDDSPLLTSEQCQKIVADYSENNSYVAQSYLGKKNLFDEKISYDNPENENSSGLNLKKLIYIFGWMLIQRKTG